jgi:hypothetical protein
MSILSIPSSPVGLTATATNSTHVRLTWSAANQADGYFVYRKISGVYTRVGDIVVGTSYTDSGLSPNTSYCYKVSAANKCGESGLSSEVCATTPCETPSTPFGLSILSYTTTTTTLGWIPTATPPLSRYIIKYGTSSPPTLTATGSPTAFGANSFTVNGLTPGVTYYFRIFADNGCAVSSGSNIVSMTMPCDLPSDPPTINLTVIAYNQINIVWGASTGAVLP